jgi:hypothetical protein
MFLDESTAHHCAASVWRTLKGGSDDASLQEVLITYRVEPLDDAPRRFQLERNTRWNQVLRFNSLPVRLLVTCIRFDIGDPPLDAVAASSIPASGHGPTDAR